MIRLIRLEIKRNRIDRYKTAALIIAGIMLCLIYFFAAIPYLEDESTDLEMFMSYNGLSIFLCVICMACFSILSAVMYNKFIIEEYTSKKALLLFSYPVTRSRILWAKVSTVFLFTVISMILSGMVIFTIFYITELLWPLCKDNLTFLIAFRTLFYIVSYSIMSASWAVISLWFGYWKKSTSVTIVSSIIIIIVFGNLLAIVITNILIAGIVAMISTLIALILVMQLSRSICTLEV